ncbi:hypothetical protein [Corynebacterium variabile]|uniref:hypothetical protein n=1 Tax=Corynebacterium variabile TaxID=1727 RepID=UPI003FD3D6FA
MTTRLDTSTFTPRIAEVIAFVCGAGRVEVSVTDPDFGCPSPQDSLDDRRVVAWINTISLEDFITLYGFMLSCRRYEADLAPERDADRARYFAVRDQRRETAYAAGRELSRSVHPVDRDDSIPAFRLNIGKANGWTATKLCGDLWECEMRDLIRTRTALALRDFLTRTNCPVNIPSDMDILSEYWDVDVDADDDEVAF